MAEDLLTINELADKLKVQKSWIYSRTREIGPNAIPRIKVGKYLRFRLEEILSWIENGNRNKTDQ